MKFLVLRAEQWNCDMHQGTDFVRTQPRKHRLGHRTGFRRQGTGLVLLVALVLLGSSGLVVIPFLLGGSADRARGRNGSLGEPLDIGEWQEMMVQMLDWTLPFTVFVPSNVALSKVLKSTVLAIGSHGKVESSAALPDLQFTQVSTLAEVTQDMSTSGGANLPRKSLKDPRPPSFHNGSTTRPDEELEAISAVISRLLAFGAIPSRILAEGVLSGSQTRWESISGYSVYVAKDPMRGLLANNISCQTTDIFRGSTVVHILEGALMDPEFEQAVTVEDEEG